MRFRSSKRDYGQMEDGNKCEWNFLPLTACRQMFTEIIGVTRNECKYSLLLIDHATDNTS